MSKYLRCRVCGEELKVHDVVIGGIDPIIIFSCPLGHYSLSEPGSCPPPNAWDLTFDASKDTFVSCDGEH